MARMSRFPAALLRLWTSGTAGATGVIVQREDRQPALRRTGFVRPRNGLVKSPEALAEAGGGPPRSAVGVLDDQALPGRQLQNVVIAGSKERIFGGLLGAVPLPPIIVENDHPADLDALE